MLFNSSQFVVFFAVVTTLFYVLPHRARWLLLLAASCAFYMAFVPVYILILATTIVVDFAAGIFIERQSGAARRAWLVGSIVCTIAILFVFKYFNFVNDNVAALARLMHWNYGVANLRLILPIGLSFHTFQSMSYVIEVYRGRQRAEKHFGIYALYVMFYPQLVAGPIERPQNLLPQLREPHAFDYRQVTDGLKLMAWGFFKKLVVADRLATMVNAVYREPEQFSGAPLVVATALFAFQIYCDFSGYSDIAIGSAQVMGFRLMKNFDRPYASRSIGEFWRRWHISLSTWFRDYLYVSLGGSRTTRWRWYRNLFITFLISGLWHGANWTVVLWGALNGLYLISSHVTANVRKQIVYGLKLDRVPTVHAAIQVGITFALTCFAFVFFRSSTLHDAFYVATHLFSASRPSNLLEVFPRSELLIALSSLALLLAVERVQMRGEIRAQLAAHPLWIRWSVYYAMVAAIFLFGKFSSPQPFIYFQF
jgi:D-alanyl-lipoteichoic acid acyltransferase DltB (MBOAT superfamily)